MRVRLIRQARQHWIQQVAVVCLADCFKGCSRHRVICYLYSIQLSLLFEAQMSVHGMTGESLLTAPMQMVQEILLTQQQQVDLPGKLMVL